MECYAIPFKNPEGQWALQSGPLLEVSLKGRAMASPPLFFLPAH